MRMYLMKFGESGANYGGVHNIDGAHYVVPVKTQDGVDVDWCDKRIRCHVPVAGRVAAVSDVMSPID